jgi:hypothetical protein
VDCADSDCTGYGACLETICDDSMDDDGDGDVDCADIDCGTDAACDSCPDVDLMMTTGTTTGTTAGETNNRYPTTCGDGGGADVTHLFTAPADATYTIDTVGTTFDTVLYVLAVDCLGLELACDDDSGMGTSSSLTVDLAAGQSVIIVVDGYRASASGDYTLNISSATMSFGSPTTAGDLVITEVMQNPRTPDTSNEWFEITNTTGSTLNLNGCTISDLGIDSSDITDDVVVGPGEYFVIGRTADVGFTPDYDWSGRLSLANADDELIITCGGTEIDRVEWDGGTTFPDPDGASMNLDDGSIDATANDMGANWCEAPLYLTPYDGVNRATPGEANPSCP